jgi:hypothetical protein
MELESASISMKASAVTALSVGISRNRLEP